MSKKDTNNRKVGDVKKITAVGKKTYKHVITVDKSNSGQPVFKPLELSWGLIRGVGDKGTYRGYCN